MKQRALVKAKQEAKALLRDNQNEPPTARSLDVSLDNADNIIEGAVLCWRVVREADCVLSLRLESAYEFSWARR